MKLRVIALIFTYILLTIWLTAWLYNNYVSKDYEIAFWISITTHYFTMYYIIIFKYIK